MWIWTLRVQGPALWPRACAAQSAANSAAAQSVPCFFLVFPWRLVSYPLLVSSLPPPSPPPPVSIHICSAHHVRPPAPARVRPDPLQGLPRRHRLFPASRGRIPRARVRRLVLDQPCALRASCLLALHRPNARLCGRLTLTLTLALLPFVRCLQFILWLPASVHAIYIVCKEAPPKLNVAQTTNYQDRYQNAPPAAPGAASWPQEQGAAQQAYPPPPGPAPTQETYLDHPVEKPAL